MTTKVAGQDRDERLDLLIAWRGLAYAHYGTCVLCGRNREGDEERTHGNSERVVVGKPLYLYGHSDDLCICFRCYCERGGSAPKQQPRTASTSEGREVVVVHVEPTEDQQEIIGKVVELRGHGLGYPKIAEALNAAGIPTLGKPGARWHGPTVRTLLIKTLGSVEAATELARGEAMAA